MKKKSFLQGVQQQRIMALINVEYISSSRHLSDVKKVEYSAILRPAIIKILKGRLVKCTVYAELWFLLLFAIPAFAQSGSFTVNGDLEAISLTTSNSETNKDPKPAIKRLYAYYMTGFKNQPDTIEVRNNHYSWSGQIEVPEKINLMVAGDPSRSVILFIEPGNMEVRHFGCFSCITVNGSSADTQFREIEQRISTLSRPLTNLRGKLQIFAREQKQDSMQLIAAQIAALESRIQQKVYREFLIKHPNSSLRLYAVRQLGGGYVIDGSLIDTLFKDLPFRDRHSKQGRQLEKDIEWSKVASLNDKESLALYVQSYPGSPVALEALMQYAGNYMEAEKVRPLFDLLPLSVQQSEEGRKFENQIKAAARSSIGKIAPIFSQKDTAGKELSLIRFRGKYVLVDFWASWCLPCRAQSPVLVKAYNKYKENGFTILGVSLERPGQREAWMNAIAKDHLNWYQVSDFKYWQNSAALMYGVMAVPQNFLIDPRGKIIAKNLFGGQLLNVLSDIFDRNINQ